MSLASRDSYLGCVGLISDPLIPFCFGHVQLREQCNWVLSVKIRFVCWVISA